jgi:hypothetical protein
MFDQILQDGITKCPADKRYVALHVFCGHMSIYCAYYDDTREIARGMAEGILDPQGVADVKAIYDVIDKEIVYYDIIGMASTVHCEWEEIKNIPVPSPVHIPAPQPDKNPREKNDHYCQYDNGEDTCYFCGEKRQSNES